MSNIWLTKKDFTKFELNTNVNYSFRFNGNMLEVYDESGKLIKSVLFIAFGPIFHDLESDANYYLLLN